MLPEPTNPTVIAHWGSYRAQFSGNRLKELLPIEGDPDPSPLANSMIDALDNPSRIRKPAIRKSFLDGGHASGNKRGCDPFVEVEWDEALTLAASELERVAETYGNAAIYGGSYGWASAGRFHHAQSQIHRFLNCLGGYTKSVQNYSYAAADTIVPYILGNKDGLVSKHSSLRSIAENSEMIVMFGGLPRKNAQVSSGGISRHILQETLDKAAAKGTRLINISPIRDDAVCDPAPEWIPLIPNTDLALILGIGHTLLSRDLHNQAFLERYTVGFSKFAEYLTGASDGVEKSAQWASAITGVPTETIIGLATEMASHRVMIMMAWSLQRADHGEQPYWGAIALACMLGQIGLPGGGFGFGYGSVNGIGNAIVEMPWPSLPQGTNKVDSYIPVARIADMLLHPGETFEFNGAQLTYPDIKLIYWAGGNPFHHHQDLNRLRKAWARPETVIVNESWWNPLAKHADIVFPVTTALERNDIAASSRDRFIGASHKVAEPYEQARNDYDVFAAIAEKLGCADAFTEGRDEEAWLRHLYLNAVQNAGRVGINLPDFESFWKAGFVLLPEPENDRPLLDRFITDPESNPLQTPSGKIELFSERIERFGYDDCPGHPAWLEPYEWLGSASRSATSLHLISNQPATRLHSQYDSGSYSRSFKIEGREVARINPSDAAARNIQNGDIVRLFNQRGSCLAAALLSDEIRQGVIQLSTGAWYDPLDPDSPNSLEKHGNPNVLTKDQGTSKLAQGPSAQTCLVEMELYDGEPSPVTAFDPPTFVSRNQT
ncbi:molybdopterin guanine dinucleotide-containing S/N-oxide reductase [Chelativorans sp. Marseille-P2723]|uniref:molybdopterin guanine dinucleotide-containing S/N-oxide reductase n=1 Tax=Chelativorans sp. Marseille-P2723 TaxID=2709133 RepID=UPI00156DDC73|nr:molybdopterin guanine dinucleotide-containing S/N-oxide reductase [Chelativorans sp. Marseille-P2723]